MADDKDKGLEKGLTSYGDRGFSVVGFPCNQFGGQEPGTAEEIAEFCSTSYGVTFPMFEKIEVNGPGRHAVYDVLTTAPDAGGEAGDIQWNFEKFLVGPDGTVIARFRPLTEPEDPAIVSAICPRIRSVVSSVEPRIRKRRFSQMSEAMRRREIMPASSAARAQ